MKRTLISAFAAAGLVGLGFGAVATADDHRRGHGKHAEKRAEMLEKYDANSDGKLDETERETARLSRFADIDTNGDGALTKSEITAHHTARMAEKIDKHFAEEDANGDGTISVEEFGSVRKARMEERRGKRSARKAEALERFDADGDGKLNEAERAAAREAGFGRRHRMIDRPEASDQN